MEPEQERLLPTVVRFALLLMVVCAFSGVALGGFYVVTKDRIAEEREKKEREALQVVFSEPGLAFTKERLASGEDFWKVRKEGDDEILGYVVKGSRYGYSSNVVVMVGIGEDRTVAAITVLSSEETPGLGENIKAVESQATILDVLTGRVPEDASSAEPWFLTRFKGKGCGSARLAADGGAIQAITGATISSRAVADAVLGALKKLEDHLGPR